MIRRIMGFVAIAVIVAMTSTATAQRGPGGPGGPGKGGPGGDFKGPKKGGPGDFNAPAKSRGGEGDETRRLQAEIERLKTALNTAEARLQQLKRGSARTGGGFGGPPARREGFARGHEGPQRRPGGPPHGPGSFGSGRFGPPPGFGPGGRGGFGGPGSRGGSAIERKLDHIQAEIDEIRRELRGSRR